MSIRVIFHQCKILFGFSIIILPPSSCLQLYLNTTCIIKIIIYICSNIAKQDNVYVVSLNFRV